MARRTSESEVAQRKHMALTSMMHVAAEALVNRKTDDVEALESLCDSYMRRFGGRKESEPTPLETLMESFKLTPEDVTKLVAEHIGGGG